MIFLALLTLAAFGFRLYRVGSISLADDEAAKWQAIQEYKKGHFVGVNSEHPMLLKLLVWASFEAGQKWNQWAGQRRWLVAREEAALRFPNLVFGALTTIVIYLLGKQMFGPVGAGAAAMFWALTPMPIALNRILKEDTLLTFFTFLAFYFFWVAKKSPGDARAGRWFLLSGAAFGLAVASKYIIHYVALNMLAWHVAGKAGLDNRPFIKPFGAKFWLVMTLAFVVANPVILFPGHDLSIAHYLSGAKTAIHGYNVDGQLYSNAIGITPFGMPWYFYFWVLLLKTPLSVLVAMVTGLLLLLWEWKTLPGIFLRVMLSISFLGYALSGAKWIRYLTVVLPFLFLAAGWAVEKLYEWILRQNAESTRRVLLVSAALLLVLWPAAEVLAWTPYCPLYLNQFGGGKVRAAKYFPQDELYDLGLREAVEYTCRVAPRGATLAASNPIAVGYYLQRCGRTDIQVGELLHYKYVPRLGDFVLVQESRLYYETKDFFYLLEHRGPPLQEIVMDGILAARIYRL